MKAKSVLFIWLGGEALVYTALIYWLVGVSLRLDVLFAGILTGVCYTLRVVRHIQSLFDINDRELVRVSAPANKLEEVVAELGEKIDAEAARNEDEREQAKRSEYHWDERMALYVSKRISGVEDGLKQLQESMKRIGTSTG